MLIIDGHVHIYNCYDKKNIFDYAYGNFLEQAKKLNCEQSFSGILLLAERPGQSFFDDASNALRRSSGDFCLGKWKAQGTTEACSLKFTRNKDEMLYLVRGKQFVSSEGLELLSIGLDKDTVAEHLSFAELVEVSTNDRDAVTVIPWSCGKWIGKRGRVLAKVLKEKSNELFLGDNGGRTKLFYSSMLSRYSRHGVMPLFSGSDPLPILGEERRIGSFGVYADTPLKNQGVVQTIKDIIYHQPEKIVNYGNLLPLTEFIRLQFLLRRVSTYLQ